MIWCQICTKYLPDPAMTKLYDAKCLHWSTMNYLTHHNDVIMSAMVFQIIGVSIAYSTVCSGADQRKHQNSVSLAFVREIHRWPANFPHKGPVMRKMFPFDDIIMVLLHFHENRMHKFIAFYVGFWWIERLRWWHITCLISYGCFWRYEWRHTMLG